MPTIAGTLSARGAVVRVEVGVSRAGRRQLLAAYRPIPQPVVLSALVDTGADVTCVDAAAVRHLVFPGRQAITPVNAPSLGGLSYQMSQEVRLAVLHPSGRPRDTLVVSDLLVAPLTLNAVGFDLLIGRDVLDLCRFVYDGPGGTFELAY